MPAAELRHGRELKSAAASHRPLLTPLSGCLQRVFLRHHTTGSLRAVNPVVRAKLDAQKTPAAFPFVFVDLSVAGWASAGNAVARWEPAHQKRSCSLLSGSSAVCRMGSARGWASGERAGPVPQPVRGLVPPLCPCLGAGTWHCGCRVAA